MGLGPGGTCQTRLDMQDRPWESIVRPIRAQLEQLERELCRELACLESVGRDVVRDMVGAGGKRIRPAVLLLTAATGQPPWGKARRAACAVEMVHTASLLHDDVLDGAAVRRGEPALSITHGAKWAILAGDILYSRAVEMCLEEGLKRGTLVLARAARTMSEAETLHASRDGDLSWTPEEYIEVAARKTGSLFAAACEIGAALGHEIGATESFAAFGLHLGTAFQIVDDVLDFLPSRPGWGKHNLADIRQRRATLPLLLAVKADVVRDWPAPDEAGRILQGSGALDGALEAARGLVERALADLEGIPDSPARTALVELCSRVVDRAT